MANYWRAISNLLVDPDDGTSVIFKTTGISLFHAASPTIFLHLANKKDFKTVTMEKLIRRAFENLPVDYIGVSTPGFWKRGSTASGLNQAALRKYATALSTAMHSQSGSEGISM